MSNAVSIDDVFSILQEFTVEVVCDLQLKSVCFERIEIFSICLSLITDLRRLTPRDFVFEMDESMRELYPPSLEPKAKRTQIVHNEDTRATLLRIASRRLERIATILETLAAIFFASDTVRNRHILLQNDR